MPTYVYGCTDRAHPRKEVVHKITEDPVIECDECGAVMKRIPQPFRFALSAVDIHYEWCDENYRRYKARRRGKRARKFSPNHVNRPIPYPARDFETRRYRKNANQTESTI